jgi:predicted CXXCH cytochrome family protein
VFIWMLATGVSWAGPAGDPNHQAGEHNGGTAACATCHRFPATRTHVVGVRPSFDVPESLPLGPGGELTCLTCHEFKAAPTSKAQSSLRAALGDSNLCTSCHTVRRDDEGSRLAHAIRVGTAHGQSAPSRTPHRSAAASLECMTCHDGVIGRDGHSPSQGTLAGSGLDLGHPVRVNYANAQTSSPTLVPAALLNGALSLENGEVGCTSCHDAFSTLRSSLVIDNRGSALCLSCHRM